MKKLLVGTLGIGLIASMALSADIYNPKNEKVLDFMV